jgi:integrase/recombinase XerC
MIEAFLKYITSELQLSDCTVEAYRSDLQQWISFATADGRHDLRPETTSTSDLRLWIASVARNGASPRTIRRKIQSLRAFFRFLMRYHGLSFNPAMDIQPPKIAKELPVYVRPEEMNALLDAENDPSDFESTRNRLIIDMFYSTGLRCSELMNLLDTNVDEKKGELKVHGKRNKDRIVPFGPELTDMITRYRNLRQQQTGCASSLTFFVRPDGQPLYRKLIYNIVHQAMEGTVHSSRKSPHVLRHSFATDMLNGGAQITSVQQLLGHQSLTATQVYTHISYRDLKQNYQLAHPRAQKKGG